MFTIVFNNIVVPLALAMTSVSAGVLFMLMRFYLISMLEIYVLVSTVAMIYVLKLIIKLSIYSTGWL
jgi:NADH:ubiquinone oxidoreductase subunit 6 (subunit J)